MQVNIHEAKSQLSKLIAAALAGEEVVIARGNKPLVRLDVLPEAVPQRRLGGVPDLVVYMSDDFDEPLEDFEPYMR